MSPPKSVSHLIGARKKAAVTLLISLMKIRCRATVIKPRGLSATVALGAGREWGFLGVSEGGSVVTAADQSGIS